MRYTRILIIPILFLIGSTLARDNEKNPLEESYIIQCGGGDEIVSFDWNTITVWKHFNAMDYVPWDTLLKILSYSVDRQTNGIADIALVDLDGDQLQEIIAVWPNYNKIEIAVLKPDPLAFWIKSMATWQKVVRLTLTNPPTFNSAVFYLHSAVFVSTGNFDADSLQEFAVAYWADNGQGKGYVHVSAYDVSDSLEVTELGNIMDQEILLPREINLCEHQTHLFNIECADFNGDNRDEILLVGRTHNFSSLNTGYRLFASIYNYDPVSKDLVNKLPSGRDFIYVKNDSLYDMTNLNLDCGYISTSDHAWGVVGFKEYTPRSRKSQTSDSFSYNLIAIWWDEDNSEIWPISRSVLAQDTMQGHCYFDRERFSSRIFTLMAGRRLSQISRSIITNTEKYEY